MRARFDEYSVRDVTHIDIHGNEAMLIEAYDAVYFSTARRKNHISISAHETRTIHLAYCVDESALDELYITPDIYGGQCEFRELKPEEKYQYIKIPQ
ncbi:MAG: hypothetical protein II919_06905 [Lachnospiraceae bacterium]|nr:hypothetical protein [Lachnospiraceae bacterium]